MRDDTLSAWGAIHVRTSCEFEVAGALRSRGVSTLMLYHRIRVKHARKVEERRRSIFSRYVIAQIGDRLDALHGMPGIAAGLICAGGDMLRIPEPVIAELKARGDRNGLITTPPPPPALAPGSQMPIVGGSLAGFLATVILDAGPKVRIWVKLFAGKPSRVTVERAHLIPPPPAPVPKPRAQVAPTVPPPAPQAPLTPEKRALAADTLRRFYEPTPLIRRQIRDPDVSGICPHCSIACRGLPPRPSIACDVRGCPYQAAVTGSGAL